MGQRHCKRAGYCETICLFVSFQMGWGKGRGDSGQA